MAHGLPDWYRGVDIAYQSLALLLARPTYGTARWTYGVETGIGAGQISLVSVSGEGMVYGGFVRLSGTGSHAADQIAFKIDGIYFVQELWSYLSLYNFVYPRGHFLTLSKYDNVNFDYCCLFSYGVTFESSIELLYTRDAGAPADNVYHSLLYALT